jgi:hypothetical protein
MDDKEVARSESGAPILKHQAPDRGPLEIIHPEQDAEALALIDAHIDRYIGTGNEEGVVFHELISDIVHIDVHIVPPSQERDYYTLVTSGMSDRPMNTPDVAADLRYAELVICLPPTWDLTEQGMKNDANFWPVGTLKMLARLPHTYDTWLAIGHTVPNGDPPEPYAPNTKLCCALICNPVLFEDGFTELRVRDGKTINFYSFLPIYEEEMNHKLKHGSSSLFELLGAKGVTEILDVARENVCKKRSWFH